MTAFTKATPGAPFNGFYSQGDTVTDSNSVVWTCAQTGWAMRAGMWNPRAAVFVAGSDANTVTVAGVGAKNGSTVSAVEYGAGGLHKTVLTLTATPVTVTDDAGVAQYGGTAKLYDFPAGHLVLLGAMVNGNLTLGVTGTIINAFTGVASLGSITATTGSTLVSTEADILKSFAIATASSKVSAVKGGPVATQITEAGALWYDGHTTALDMYLNFAIADDATHTSGTGTFTGSVVVHWINLGDN